MYFSIFILVRKWQVFSKLVTYSVRFCDSQDSMNLLSTYNSIKARKLILTVLPSSVDQYNPGLSKSVLSCADVSSWTKRTSHKIHSHNNTFYGATCHHVWYRVFKVCRCVLIHSRPCVRKGWPPSTHYCYFCKLCMLVGMYVYMHVRIQVHTYLLTRGLQEGRLVSWDSRLNTLLECFNCTHSRVECSLGF